MVEDGPTPALKVAAKNAWWNMNRNSICDFASLSGTAISDSASLFEAAFLATKGVLTCSDDEALTIMGKRLAHDSNDQAFAAELMELDCAIEMSDHTDHEALRNDMKAAARNLDLIENFEMELQSTRQDMLKAKKNEVMQIVQGHRLLSISRRRLCGFLHAATFGLVTPLTSGGGIWFLSRELLCHGPSLMEIAMQHAWW